MYLWRDITDFISSIGIHDLIEIGLLLCWIGIVLLPVRTGDIVSFLTYCLVIVSMGLVIFYILPMKHVKTPGNYGIFIKSSMIMFIIASIRWFHQILTQKVKTRPIQGDKNGKELG